MSLEELLPLTPVFGAGLAVGVIFHLGLWWTVVRGLGPHRSALWFPASMVLRVGATLGAFYLLGAGQWQRFVACLAGFLISQLLVTRKP